MSKAIHNKIYLRHGLYKLVEKHQEWRVDAIISKIEERYFLAPRTIEAIIKRATY
ncbi:hypothetical protein GO491_04090 [Flavobacteriaceae bacterium Ap0902]|nr:hypothetical protein [Flavobacteriaceae bacterium Ap0902]